MINTGGAATTPDRAETEQLGASAEKAGSDWNYFNGHAFCVYIIYMSVVVMIYDEYNEQLKT